MKMTKSFALEREPFARRFASAYSSCGFVYTVQTHLKNVRIWPQGIALFCSLVVFAVHLIRRQ